VKNRVLVIGGGLVALDAAREARRQILAKAGVDTLKKANAEVHVSALESMKEMPSAKSVSGLQELEEAVDEEIIFHPSFGPNKIIGDSNGLTGMEVKAVTSVFDEEGRFNPKFDENNKKTIHCDTIIFAVGQMADLSFVKESDKITVTQRGTIQITDSLATDAAGIFAGGDVAFGPKNLIDAVANGKQAAVSIDEFFSGRKRTKEYKVSVEVLPQDSYSMIDEYDHKTRSTPPVAEPEKRIGMNEVEFSFDNNSAMEQASRCLTCHTSPIYDGDICILCGRCTDICPEYCLTFVSIHDVDMPQEERDEVLKNLMMAGQDDITVMLKDDEKCIRCGLCSLRCPTGALRMERIVVEEVTGAA
ncbi:MAG: FAD-dependent oxidoreductase, partial [Spirochaetia bacterium]|nr:FAD-dependent oxidoreductase [Spirochaetia bacterium]